MRFAHVNVTDFVLLQAIETFEQWLGRARHRLSARLNLRDWDQVITGKQLLWGVTPKPSVDLQDQMRVLFIMLNSGLRMSDTMIATSTPNTLMFNRSADRLRHGRRELASKGIIKPAGRVTTATATATAWVVADEFKGL